MSEKKAQNFLRFNHFGFGCHHVCPSLSSPVHANSYAPLNPGSLVRRALPFAVNQYNTCLKAYAGKQKFFFLTFTYLHDGEVQNDLLLFMGEYMLQKYFQQSGELN